MPEPKSQSSRMTRQRLHEIIFVADTNLGQMFASLVMMPGYGIIAIPTGIVTLNWPLPTRLPPTQSCPHCLAEGHALDAKHCEFCGAELNPGLDD